MQDRELKRLGRAELIDIILEQQKRLDESEKHSQELQQKLEERELQISETGSIAEAALKVNGVFEAAQAAADDYLLSIKAATAESKEKIDAAERRRLEILDSANRRSLVLIREAEEKAKDIVEEAEKQSEEKWKDFEQRANDLIAAHEALLAFVGKGERT